MSAGPALIAPERVASPPPGRAPGGTSSSSGATIASCISLVFCALDWWFGINGSLLPAMRALAVASVLGGFVIFLKHGRRRVTAAGIYCLTAGIMNGCGAWYWADVVPPSTTRSSIFLAAVSVYATTNLMHLLFWSRPNEVVRDDEVRPRQPVPARLAKTLGMFGLALFVVGAVAQRAGFGFGTLSTAAADVGVVAFASSLLLSGGVSVLRSPIRTILVAVALGAYYLFVFSGGGRLRLAALLITIAVVAQYLYRSRIKAVAIAALIPLLVLFAAIGESRTPSGSTYQASASGLGSLVNPLEMYGQLIGDRVTSGHGSTLVAEAVVLVPRSVWPGKPVLFGRAAALELRPDEANASNLSLALMPQGEWFYNFAWVGLILLVLLVGWAVRLLDRRFFLRIRRGISDYQQLFTLIALAILVGSVADLAWGGTSTWITRNVQRLLLVVPVIVWAHLVGSKQRRPRVVRPQAQDGRGRHPVVRGGTPLPAPPRRPRHDATGRHAAPADAVAFDWSGDTAAFGTAVSADLATQPGRRASGTAMGRAVAAFVDEALSSLQNFVIMFAALRYLPVRTLGWFTVAYTAALFFKALLRALLLEPLSIRFAGEDRGTLRRAGARAAGASLATGTACLVVVALLGLALRGEARSITVAVALCLPMLITQEAWRVYFFAAARSWRAVVNDGLCFVGTLALLVLYVVSGAGVSAAGLMVLWAVGIGIGVVWGIVQSRAWPLLGQAWHWLREQWDLGSRLAAARGAERAANQVVNILVVAIAGSLALGQLSASRTIVAPVTTALMATGTFAVPEAVRLYRRRDPRLKILIPAISLSLGGLVAAAGLAVYFAPGDVGSVIAGENWEVARSLFIPTLLWVVAIALRQGPLAGLRVYQRAKTVLYLSTSTAAVLVVAVAVAAALDGARGAAWAFAVVFFVSSAVSWVCYRRATAAVWRSERGSLSER